MTSALSISAILNGAADLIEARGFMQGNEVGSEKKGEGKLDVALAMYEYADELIDSFPAYTRSVYEARRAFLTRITGGDYTMVDSLFALYRWNDEDGRTQTNVVADLRRVAREVAA